MTHIRTADSLFFEITPAPTHTKIKENSTRSVAQRRVSHIRTVESVDPEHLCVFVCVCVSE